MCDCSFPLSADYHDEPIECDGQSCAALAPHLACPWLWMTSTAVPPAVRSPLEKAQHALAEFAVVAGGQLSEGQPAEETVLLPREPDASARTLCRPWHKRDLYQRLRSYRSSTWFGKPEAVSELQCSSRGWRNVDVDVLTCEVVQPRCAPVVNQESRRRVSCCFGTQVCQARVTFPPVAAQPGNSPAGVLAQVKQVSSLSALAEQACSVCCHLAQTATQKPIHGLAPMLHAVHAGSLQLCCPA